MRFKKFSFLHPTCDSFCPTLLFILNTRLKQRAHMCLLLSVYTWSSFSISKRFYLLNESYENDHVSLVGDVEVRPLVAQRVDGVAFGSNR